MQRSEGMQLIEKTWNHTQNQKKGYIFGDGQQAYYLQVLISFLVVDLSQQSGIEIPSDKYWKCS